MNASPAGTVSDRRDPLERLLGLVESRTASSGTEEPCQVVGHRDDVPTWLVSNEWRLFARPSRDLVTGGREIAQFELPDRTALSASVDLADR